MLCSAILVATEGVQLMTEREVMHQCSVIFERLGWEVRTEELFEIGRKNPFRCDIVLRHNDEIYGFVEVINRDNLKEKAEKVLSVLNSVVGHLKPKVFIITNGFSFDLYHFGDFYGSLTVPPTPEDVDILFGGEEE